MHCHSNWTDGKDSTIDIINHAIKRNLKCIGISDHIRKSSSYFDEYYDEINLVRKSTEKIDIFIGCESKILENFNLDISIKDFSKAEFVIASVHSIKMNEKRVPLSNVDMQQSNNYEFNYLKNFILNCENKKVFIGHPFGMSSKFHGKIDMNLFEEIIKISCKKNFCIEISYAYHNKFMSEILTILNKFNPIVVFNSDAHRKEDLRSWDKFNIND